jgi:hypothetical protein
MENAAITFKTCRGAHTSHKLINESNKLRGSMIRPIEDNVSLNSALKRTTPSTKKTKTIVLPTLKQKALFIPALKPPKKT